MINFKIPVTDNRISAGANGTAYPRVQHIQEYSALGADRVVSAPKSTALLYGSTVELYSANAGRVKGLLSIQDSPAKGLLSPATGATNTIESPLKTIGSQVKTIESPVNTIESGASAGAGNANTITFNLTHLESTISKTISSKLPSAGKGTVLNGTAYL